MKPPAPLNFDVRLRLGWRAVVAVVLLAGFFAIFLLVRGVSRSAGARVVQGWAATALPLLGLSYVQRGAPMQGSGAFVANHSIIRTAIARRLRRCNGRRRRFWSRKPRSATGRGSG